MIAASCEGDPRLLAPSAPPSALQPAGRTEGGTKSRSRAGKSDLLWSALMGANRRPGRGNVGQSGPGIGVHFRFIGRSRPEGSEGEGGMGGWRIGDMSSLDWIRLNHCQVQRNFINGSRDTYH